jgi:uncharacterized membrane protein
MSFALLVVLYLFNAQTFLIDKNVFAWDSSGEALSPRSSIW